VTNNNTKESFSTPVFLEHGKRKRRRGKPVETPRFFAGSKIAKMDVIDSGKSTG
jgi:hypothetical protein